MKSAIITGAGGFIGGALAEKLLKQGVEVIAVDVDLGQLKKRFPFSNISLVQASFDDYPQLADRIGRPADVFYHFAWKGVFGEAFQDYRLQLLNASYACQAAECAAQLGCKKYVLSGTGNEFEVYRYFSMEQISPRYTCIYAASKFAAEMIAKTLLHQKGLEYSAGLISMVFGKNNYSKMLPNVLISRLLHEESPKLVEGRNLYDMIYIDDVAEAFYRIGESGHNMKSYYIGHRKLRAFRDWVTEIRDILAPGVSLKFGEYPDTLDMDYSLIDLDALYKDTGFECKADFRESILKTAEWVKTLKW